MKPHHALLLGAALGLSPLSQAAAPAPACASYSGTPLAALQHYKGLLHAHTAYSDGDIHARPVDVYEAAYENGLDFAGSSDHSDNLNDLLYLSLGAECFASIQGLLTCITPTPDGFDKWQHTQTQAQFDSSSGFAAFRGFEWTSDRFGHINVFFSSNFTNAKLDGGYAFSMQPFWNWLLRKPGPAAIAGVTLLGGGADGVAIFNHPNDKKFSDTDPARNWNLLSYVPAADRQMVGMELYNSGAFNDDAEGGRHDYYGDWYMSALNQGWHVGAVGGEDMHNTTWAQPVHPKTVILADKLDNDSLKQAMLARRMYALVSDLPADDLLVDFSADGYPMGSRLSCDAGKTVALTVTVRPRAGGRFKGILRLYDHADPNQPLGSGSGAPLAVASGDTLRYSLPVKSDGEHWFFVRVDNPLGQSLAYTSPVWISPRGR